MAGIGTHLGPLICLRVAVGIVNQVKNVLYVFIHILHRYAALLSSTEQFAGNAVAVLARYPCGNYRQRLRPDVLTKLKILIISQAHCLTIAPKVLHRLASVQRTNCVFPTINVVYTLSVSHATAWEADKLRMNIGYGLCKVGTQAVPVSAKSFFREQRHHVNVIPTYSHRRDKKLGIISRSPGTQRS